MSSHDFDILRRAPTAQPHHPRPIPDPSPHRLPESLPLSLPLLPTGLPAPPLGIPHLPAIRIAQQRHPRCRRRQLPQRWPHKRRRHTVDADRHDLRAAGHAGHRLAQRRPVCDAAAPRARSVPQRKRQPRLRRRELGREQRAERARLARARDRLEREHVGARAKQRRDPRAVEGLQRRFRERRPVRARVLAPVGEVGAVGADAAGHVERALLLLTVDAVVRALAQLGERLGAGFLCERDGQADQPQRVRARVHVRIRARIIGFDDARSPREASEACRRGLVGGGGGDVRAGEVVGSVNGADEVWMCVQRRGGPEGGVEGDAEALELRGEGAVED